MENNKKKKIVILSLCALCLFIPDLIHWNEPLSATHADQGDVFDVSTIFFVLFWLFIPFVYAAKEDSSPIGLNIKVVAVVLLTMGAVYFIFDTFLLAKVNGVYYNNGSYAEPRAAAMMEMMVVAPIVVVYVLRNRLQNR